MPNTISCARVAKSIWDASWRTVCEMPFLTSARTPSLTFRPETQIILIRTPTPSLVTTSSTWFMTERRLRASVRTYPGTSSWPMNAVIADLPLTSLMRKYMEV